MIALSRFMPTFAASSPRTTRPGEVAHRRFAVLCPLVFAAFLLLGGGGAPHAIILIPLQIIALVALAGLAYWHMFVERIPLRFWPSGLLLGAILILGVAQLVPLPPSVWMALPGRDLAADIVREAGLGGKWHSWSLAPEYTLSALLTLLPAIATFLAVSACDAPRRLQLAKVMLLVILLSAALGALQLLTGGNEALYLSPRSIFGAASGIFANRNFQADFLLIGIFVSSALMLVAKGKRQKRQVRPWATILIGLLATMVFAAQSRFGVLLLIAVLLITFFRFDSFRLIKDRFARRPAAPVLVLIGIAALIIAPLLLMLLGQRLLMPVLSRFGFGSDDPVEEMRVDAIPDLIVAIGQYFPFGSGLGTFDPVFRRIESLETLSDKYFNHAHNDYVELLIETGIFGPAIVLLFLFAFAIRSWKVFREPSHGEMQILERTAVLALGLLLVHSIVDYPLRTVTIQVAFAYFAAVLFMPTREEDTSAVTQRVTGNGRGRRFGFIAIIAISCVLGSVLIARVGLARQAVLARSGELAYQIRPENPRGTALAADTLITTGEYRAASKLARQALSAFPADALATRVLGEAQNALQPGSGTAMLQLASLTGWRDRPTQSWVIERALTGGDYRTGTMRAEALARLRSNPSTTYAFMRILTLQPEARDLLVESLARQPAWRTSFLMNDDPKTPEQLSGMALMLTALAQTSAPPTLPEARPIIDAMAREDRHLEAYDLYRVVAPDRIATGRNLVIDGTFERQADEYFPGSANTIFDWRVFEAGESFAQVETVLDDRDNTALFVGGAHGENGRLAEKIVTLPAGRYNLSYRVRIEDGEGIDGLRWIVRCADANGARLAAEPLGGVEEEQWRTRTFAFEVPSDCSAQVLEIGAFEVPLGSNPAALIDDIVLQRSNRRG